MLRADIIVLEALRLFLGQPQHVSCQGVKPCAVATLPATLLIRRAHIWIAGLFFACWPGRERYILLSCALAAYLREYHNSLDPYFLQVDAQTFEHSRRDTFSLTNQAQQQVFCANIVVIQTTSLVNRQLDH